MDKETIEVTIKRDGTLSYEVKGVKGASCKELTAAIDAMTKNDGLRGNTDEFYETPPEKNQLFNQRF